MTKNSSQGFTLIETLVAISILVLSITGAFSAAQNGVNSAIFSKDQILAFYLAQEGIEQIRNMRDENGVNGRNWLEGIAETGNPCELEFNCIVDAYNNTITKCIGACPKIKLNPSNYYEYLSGTETKFTRVLKISAISPSEVSVSATVSWSKGLVPMSFTAKESLHDWQ